MSEHMKHTPGDWTVSGTSIVSESAEMCIAVIEDDGEYAAPREQREANARLIAAAPDLLEACKATVEELRSVTTGSLYVLRCSIEAALARVAQPEKTNA